VYVAPSLGHFDPIAMQLTSSLNGSIRRKKALLSLISSSVNQGATIYVGIVVFGVSDGFATSPHSQPPAAMYSQ